MKKFVIYNRYNGKRQAKYFDTLQEAVKEAGKQNLKVKKYSFLVTCIKH